jgi:glycerol uptake facilitator-like aquaporin
MIFAWCMFGGQITGGHYNPAVSIGVYISNKHWKEDWYMMGLMIVA